MKLGVLASMAALCCWCVFLYPASAQDSRSATDDGQLPALAERLAGHLVKRNCGKITALDFTDIQGRPNELGRYLAEQLSAELFSHEGLTILDRANFASIMREHQLTAEGLVENPGDAKKLGQFAGVKAILVGTLTTPSDETIQLSVKAISTDTAEWVASGQMTLRSTDALRRMLGQSSSGGNGSSSGTGSEGAGAWSKQSEIITKRDVGPVVIALRSVQRHEVETSSGSQQAIRCVFDVENRNLEKYVAIAVNQRLKDHYGTVPKMVGYRGDVLDEKRGNWAIVDVNGIPGVACFEVEESTSIGSKFQFSQRNPGGVADALRRGKRFNASTTDYGTFWAGSCDSIPPGGTVQCTVDVAPTKLDPPSRRRRGSEEDSAQWPASFQFGMELVLGTFKEGEDPLKAKDLALRTLSIDRVVLPKDPDAAVTEP